MKVAVTVTGFCTTIVQLDPEDIVQPVQPPKVEVPCGFAVRTTVVPTVNEALQVLGLEQLIPVGRLVTLPLPDPTMFTVSTACAPEGVQPREAGPLTTIDAELLVMSLPVA